MKIFKFGGASIKDFEAVRNMAGIIELYTNEDLVIVVSAMGKTTNQLEQVVTEKLHHIPENPSLKAVRKYHTDITDRLFDNKDRPVHRKLVDIFDELKAILELGNNTDDPGKFYDSVVSYGEILSSSIISEYLNDRSIACEWIDARQLVRTDGTFREARVNWELTRQNIREALDFNGGHRIFITQGFIGSSENHHVTTLGREGSDFTAAIFAACLQADSVTIWKDVPGILNADPKRFPETQLYKNLSYREAAEMTYYGASVIHPKTIKPLANKNIPLYVRSFEHPELAGTVINQGEMHELPPTFVIKDAQCLITFGVRDLDFINEKSLSVIFHVLDLLNIKLNMMQNSAISFTCCIDYHETRIRKLLEILQNDFTIRYNDRLQLITIKNYTEEAIRNISAGKDILVEQRTRHTFQLVVR